MKDVSQDVIDAEISDQRRPAEGYHFWQEGIDHWFFTSGDAEVIHDSNTYVPIPISRSGIRRDTSVNYSTLRITVDQLQDPPQKYLDQMLLEDIWIEVFKFHRDMSPIESTYVFCGKVLTASFKGVMASFDCVDLLYLLQTPVPKYRYQAGCLRTLYDTKCTLVKEDYDRDVVISSNSGTLIEGGDFGAEVAGYYTQGYVYWNGYHRFIIDHGLTPTPYIKLRYPMPEALVAGETVTVYAGCDKDINTCHDKFSNVVNFLGFHNIPWLNPVLTY